MSLQRLLDVHSAGDCLDDARELCQQVIPNCVHHTAPALLYEACHHAPAFVQGLERCRLVVGHESRVSDSIRAEEGREPAGSVTAIHRAIPPTLLSDLRRARTRSPGAMRISQ
jgi:hypothetical protein